MAITSPVKRGRADDANIRAAIESLDETSMDGASGFADFFKMHISCITPKLAQAYKDML